jgi:uncharacterized membrane protein (DUF485 family)
LNGLIALENGERLKVPEITAIAKRTWQKMSYDEQKAVTTQAIQELQEIREMKTLSKRNVALSAFHDTKKTLESIENQVSPILVILFFAMILLNVYSRFWLYMHVPPQKSPSLPFAATRIITMLLILSYLVPGSRNSSTSAFARHCLILHFVLRPFAYLGSKVYITVLLIVLFLTF